jgi:hypothetical protein
MDGAILGILSVLSVVAVIVAGTRGERRLVGMRVSGSLHAPARAGRGRASVLARVLRRPPGPLSEAEVYEALYGRRGWAS